MKPVESDWKDLGKGPMFWPFNSQSVRPRNTSMPARVTMNEGMRQIGHPIALRRADHKADDQAGGHHGPDRPMQIDGQHRRHRTDKADDGADGKVDMARDDDQQHPQRHDDDVGVLQKQVGDVLR